jgi:hypothetical protein
MHFECLLSVFAITHLIVSSYDFFFLCFEKGAEYIAQAGPELMSLWVLELQTCTTTRAIKLL